MERQIAFIDESGNYGFKFDKKGVSRYFIITAIIVNQEELYKLEEEFEAIRKKHFQQGEMKSSGIRTIRRRVEILKDMNEKNFHIYALVIDKKELYLDGGLGYKASFIKYLNGKLHNELFSIYPNLQMFADEHGSKEFMIGFKKYINKNHIPDLFNEANFSFNDSKDKLLIQVADVIAGSIFKVYENPEEVENKKVLDAIRDKIIRIVEWPDTISFQKKHSLVGSAEKHDHTVRILSMNLAKQFISKHEGDKDSIINDQVNFLKYLLLNRSFDEKRFISSYEIIKNLEAFRAEKIQTQYLRTRIVAQLRDNGLIIISSDKGYKLPISAEELINYVNFSNSTITPMLNRIGKSRDSILLATKNKLDILNYPEFAKIKRYFDE